MHIWQEMGDHLLVLTDFNDDVTAADARKWAAEFGLVEAITYLNAGPVPPTYQRGSRPIDGMFIAPQLLPFAAGGYLAFGDAVPSDHRVLWLDLHLPELCPKQLDVHVKPQARRLQCRDPRIVARYNKRLLELLNNHNVKQRLSILQEQLRQPGDLRQSHRKELNSIDLIVTEARLSAEKSCRKLKCGQVQWSPPVTKLIYKILFWKGLLKREKGGKVSLHVLRSRAKKAQLPQVPYPGEISQQQIQEKISAAYKSLARFKRDENSRDTWIAQLIAAQASAWQKTKKALWKQLRTTERIQNTARNVRRALNKTVCHRPLSLVIAPDAQGNRTEINQKAAMEQACLDEAGRRFTQAKHTPFLTSPLIDLFGEIGNKKPVCQVLEGSFVPPSSSDRYAQQFLAAVARTSQVADIPPRSVEEYSAGWKKAREATSSSASGTHFGHYIAGTFNPEILLINATLANLPLLTGFTYDRWKKGLNIMIEKTTGDFNVDKLRIILLFEADFNANNKWMGRAVMYQAEQERLLADEQFGSRKFKSAIFQCFNKLLLYDLARFRRTPMALCSNDAKSCYDQITLVAATLCLCRLGCPFASVQSMITTLHDMQHHIRTTFGDSHTSASRKKWHAPIAGIGQGNGAGPQIWAAVSSPMFEIMRSQGFYANIVASISGLTKQLVGFAFVDDTDLCVHGPHITRNNARESMQKSVDEWQGLLRATGGALVPAKCFWYLIDFQWSNSKWVYQSATQFPGEVNIYDDSLHRVPIPRLEPFEARRTLGVRLAPDGNWDTEVEYLKSIAVDWKVKMAASKLSWEEALFSLKNVVLRKLHYPLVTTTLNPQQCHQITSPLLQQGLPKAGVIRTFPRALAHGPLEYGGLDIPNLFTEQIIAHISTLLRYGPSPNESSGTLLHASGEAMRLELGYNGELLAAPLVLAENVTNSWIKHVWTSTQERAITVSTNFSDIPIRRKGDIEIMRLFVQEGWKQPDLNHLNQCWMFLQVFLLSDMVEGSGRRIIQSCWDHPQPIDSPFIWPRMHDPPRGAWNLWRSALTQSLRLGRNQQLALPLGNWFAENNPAGWYYHPETNALWSCGQSQWTRYGGIPQRTRQRSFHGQGELSPPPKLAELHKATTSRRGSTILLTGSAKCAQSNTNQDFCQAMRATEFSQQWGLTLNLTGSQTGLLAALSAGEGFAVCDGSYKDNTGAAAWIMEGQNSSIRLTGQWHTPGQDEDHSSFRSELAGIIGVLYTLQFWPPRTTKPLIRVACNGLSVINRLLSQRPIDASEPHYDMLSAAKNLMLDSSYQVQLVFVRGHQDSTYPTALSRDAWLNIEADTLAKAKTSLPHVGPHTYKLPGFPWGCYVGSKRVVKQLAQSLRTHVNGQATLKYWATKKQWLPDRLQTVDWSSLGRAMRSAKAPRRRWASKQMSGHFAHGKNMVRWQKRNSSACPRCGSPENKEHIIRCNHTEATSTWNTTILALQKWMQEEQFDPMLITDLIAGLQQWRSGSQPTSTSVSTQSQNLLGWDALLDGWLSVEWRLQQEAYWNLWRKKKSSKRWIAELIKKLWNTAWDMWANRNGILHSSTVPREDILDSRINEQITSIYQHGLQEVPRDAFNLFKRPLTELLQNTRAYKEKWLASVEAAKARKRHHDFGAYLPEQRLMRRWLGLDIPPNGG